MKHASSIKERVLVPKVLYKQQKDEDEKDAH
jgi:hypothetical protein